MDGVDDDDDDGDETHRPLVTLENGPRVKVEQGRCS